MEDDFLEYWLLNGKDDWDGLTDLVSPYEDNLGHPEDGNQVSQDQVWNYLLGLAMVKHFVDATDTYEDYPCEYVTLEDMAKLQAYRSIKFMHSFFFNPR